MHALEIDISIMYYSVYIRIYYIIYRHAKWYKDIMMHVFETSTITYIHNDVLAPCVHTHTHIIYIDK